MDNFLKCNFDKIGGRLGKLENCILDSEFDKELLLKKEALYNHISDLNKLIDKIHQKSGRAPREQKYAQYSTNFIFKDVISNYCITYLN